MALYICISYIYKHIFMKINIGENYQNKNVVRKQNKVTKIDNNDIES